DIIWPRGGNDTVDGGSGTDLISYAGYSRGVKVSLATTAAQATGAGRVVARGFENLTGTSHDDTLPGTNGANVITGRSAHAHLSGYADKEQLCGTAGADGR